MADVDAQKKAKKRPFMSIKRIIFYKFAEAVALYCSDQEVANAACSLFFKFMYYDLPE